MKRTASALVLAGSLAFFGAGAAYATTTPSPYPAEDAAATGTVSDPVVAPGEPFVFSGSGFTPGETIDIDVVREASEPTAAAASSGGRLAAARGGAIILAQQVLDTTTTADAEGDFAVTITLHEEGVYTLTATGRESGEQATAVVTAVGEEAAPVAGGGEVLADTGVDGSMILLGAAGLGALGLGAASVVVARRRSGAEA
jgi:LPXTG-motif cell wall-anchored protein